MHEDSYTRHFAKSITSKTPSDEYKFKLLNTVSSKEITYRYGLTKHEYQNKKKVLFSIGRYIYPFYDSGELGTTESGLICLVDNKTEGDILIKYLNSDLITFIIKATKFNNFAVSHELISNLPDPNKFDPEFFKFSDNDLKFIKKYSDKPNI